MISVFVAREKPLTLRQLQDEQREWSDRNFPNKTENGYSALLGVVEEVGELCHAHLKTLQGIRYTSEQGLEKKKDAIGDIIIFLADYCSMNGIDLQEVVECTWNQVKQRDWIANPITANQE